MPKIKNYSLLGDLPKELDTALDGFSDLSKRLFFRRGISSGVAAREFLYPDYSAHTHSQTSLKDIDRATKRIIEAICKDEKIIVYGDYDTDGLPASAIFHSFFRKIGFGNFVNYIPDRHHEGFGLNSPAVKKFAADGARLIVTVDCGITDVEPVKVANDLGMDVIITDHHMPGEVIPSAYAIVNPKQSDCNYPEKMLCGSGVAFKLILNLIESGEFKDKITPGWEKWLLDLVGIATVSDMVPLVGENRVLAKFGLTVLRKTKRVGLQTLFSKVGLVQAYITEEDIGFSIGPRINAASRMSTPMDAFNLITSETESEALKFADHLNNINNERKAIVATAVKEVKSKIKERWGDDLPRVVVIGNPKWQPGILGLVANSCAEEYGRPFFVWGRDVDGEIKGSCRGAGLVSLPELMSKCPPNTFLRFGGHVDSGGFSVSLDKVHELHDVVNDASSIAKYGVASSEITIDAVITLDDVGQTLYSEIESFAPFGMGNPKPLFLLRNVKPIEIKKFGKSKEHMELIFKNSKGQPVSAIAFFKNPKSFTVSPEKDGEACVFDLIATMEKSFFAGRTRLRLRVEDIVSSGL